jgi:hypothetical protein
MSIKQSLREEIEKEIKELGGLPLGSDEYRTTVDGVTKLIDRLDGLENSEFEREDKVAMHGFESDLKLQQMKDEKKDRRVTNCIAIAGIVLPLAVTIWGTKASFKFEKDGTITTIMGRGFISKMIPKK